MASTEIDVQALNIFQRMSAITNELNVVQKGLSVGYGNNKYKAVSERDVLDAVKPLEYKYGVYSYPLESEITKTETLTKVTTDRDGNPKESTQFRIFITIKYRFVNVDNPEEHIDITSYGDGIDSGDKAPGKAMTYAGKYALLKAYKISTGDDPDAEASPENGYQRAKGEKFKCAVCGKEIDGVLAQQTMYSFGRYLCKEHADEALRSQQAHSAPR